MPAPNQIIELVDRFAGNIAEYKSISYKETRLRIEFLNPFFEALGWDVSNRMGQDEVVHEDRLRIEGKVKAPDYSFYVGNIRKFYVEAKAPSVNLRDNSEPAFQLRRYAWSAKLGLSVLSDFEEFVIYDGRIEPRKDDRSSVARVHYYTYKDYVGKWDDISAIFSRAAVYDGALDEYAEAFKSIRGSSVVDVSFLREIEGWRAELADDIAYENDLTTRELNEAVQRTIDRIIFLRICEDRGIEDYGRLKRLADQSDVYSHLCEYFNYADQRYNSGLFHFENERGRSEQVDNLTLNLTISDSTLKRIINNLYYPDSPYEFSVMSADILGQVYEQFLGKVIRQTFGGAVVDDKPEVKKAGGVFYTPTYVVDYIVRETVGSLLRGKTPKQVEKVRILDPSCGSGSFLIGAYQYLIDWHREWYISDGINKHARKIYQSAGNQWQLTVAEKKRILLNNIYGVDIDAQAVEVTKLSLLLKVLEGESEQSISRQLRLFHERALPDLGNNIKCGNSLISSGFYRQQQLDLLQEEDHYRINVFDWEAAFPSAMKSGGFDAVIGNPPWGADFTDVELAYLRSQYKKVISRMIDSYIYFIYKATLISKERSPIGFIIPSTLLNQVDAKPIRELLIDRGLSTLVGLGQGIFGTKVLNTSTIFISEPQKPSSKFSLGDVSALTLQARKTALNSVTKAKWKEWQGLVKDDPHKTFIVGNVVSSTLLNRLREQHPDLETFLVGTIQRGVSPDVVAAHVVTRKEIRAEKLERELLKPSVSGTQIKRYRNWSIDQFLIYTGRATPIREYPNIKAHLERFRKFNSCKEVVDGKHPWWGLHRPRDPEIFEQPKLIGLTTSKTIELIYDAEGQLYVTDAMYVFCLRYEYDPWATMAILQSKLFLFLYRTSNQGESRVIPQVKASKLQVLPFPDADKSSAKIAQLSRLTERMMSLYVRSGVARTERDKAIIENQIRATNEHIDGLVYELYELSPTEKDLVSAA